MLNHACWAARRGVQDCPAYTSDTARPGLARCRHGVDTTDNTTHGRPVADDATHGNPHGTWFKVWESDCSNYGGCHPWFFGGDNPQSLSLMMSHWESTYGLG